MVVGDFLAKPFGTVKSIVFVRQFDFGHDETFVVAMKHINFPSVLAIRVFHKIARLFDKAAFNQPK